MSRRVERSISFLTLFATIEEILSSQNIDDDVDRHFVVFEWSLIFEDNVHEIVRNRIFQKFHHANKYSISYVTCAISDISNTEKKFVDHDLTSSRSFVIERENDDILQLSRKRQILSEIYRMWNVFCLNRKQKNRHATFRHQETI